MEHARTRHGPEGPNPDRPGRRPDPTRRGHHASRTGFQGETLLHTSAEHRSVLRSVITPTPFRGISVQTEPYTTPYENQPVEVRCWPAEDPARVSIQHKPTRLPAGMLPLPPNRISNHGPPEPFRTPTQALNAARGPLDREGRWSFAFAVTSRNEVREAIWFTAELSANRLPNGTSPAGPAVPPPPNDSGEQRCAEMHAQPPLTSASTLGGRSQRTRKPGRNSLWRLPWRWSRLYTCPRFGTPSPGLMVPHQLMGPKKVHCRVSCCGGHPPAGNSSRCCIFAETEMENGSGWLTLALQ
jgi:hypothetical protein